MRSYYLIRDAHDFKKASISKIEYDRLVLFMPMEEYGISANGKHYNSVSYMYVAKPNTNIATAECYTFYYLEAFKRTYC